MNQPHGSLPRSPLAIVGMACRFPGADNLDEFWQLLRTGRCALGPLPPERFDLETTYDPKHGVFGKTYCRIGGVVELRPVDKSLLPVADERLAQYDIGQRTLCEVAAAACRHAGYDPLALPSRNAGVFVGNSSGGSELEFRQAYHRHAPAMAALLNKSPEFSRLDAQRRAEILESVIKSVRRDHPGRCAAAPTSFSPHVAALMIAEIFGLTGPAMVTDAACASSFVALQAAEHQLSAGRIDLAIVAGAAYRKLYELIAIAQAGSMSETKSCPFDASADGILCSDGFGAIVVKRLDRAFSDGDRILAVVRGIGVSSDGRGKGFWAPRAEGQTLAIRRAYEAQGVDQSGVQYIEAHATSTQLGDATEVEALTAAFSGKLREKIPIASVKGNIGHTLETAGMAGLIKTILAMHAGMMPPAPNFRTPNPEIPWSETPFYVPSQAAAWPAIDVELVRRAGIDSFGIGGLNVHVVIDQSAAPPASSFAPAPSAFPRAPLEPIAIVGRSCILPGADSPDAYWRQLLEGTFPAQPVPPERWEAQVLAPEATDPLLGGFITGYEFDWKKFKVPPKQLECANLLQFMMLDAADRALQDAGDAGQTCDRMRTGTVVGSIFRSDFIVDHWYGAWLWDFVRRLKAAMQQQGLDAEIIEQVANEYARTLMQQKPAARDETGSISSSTLSSRISKYFDLMGGAYAVDSADASSTAALTIAIDRLRSGDCDTMICVGGQRSLDVTVFDDYGFGAGKSGSTPAEGVVCLILKRHSDAMLAGDRIYGILHSAEERVEPRRPNAQSDVLPAAEALNIGVRQESQRQPDLFGGNTLLDLLQAVLVFEHGLLPPTWTEGNAPVPLAASTRRGTCVVQLESHTSRGLREGERLSHTSRVIVEGGSLPVPASEERTESPVQPPAAKAPPVAEFDATSARRERMKREAAERLTPHASIAGSANSTANTSRAPETQSPMSAAPQKKSAVTITFPAAAKPSPGAPQERARPPQAPESGLPQRSAVERRMTRFVPVMLPDPLPADAPKLPVFHGPVLLLGSNPTAIAIQQKLVDAGASVHLIPSGTEVTTAVAEVERCWTNGPIHHLLLLTARDENADVNQADPGTWLQRRDAGLLLPFAVCQKWFALVEAAKLFERASLVAVTGLGGDFGFSGQSDALEGGGLTGMLKSLHNETRRKLKVRTIDAPRRDPAKLVAAEVLGELAVDSGELEVGYIRGTRQVVRELPQPAASLPRRAIDSGSVWVVTGGARGVTAEVALELGRRFQLKLHLLGSSPLPAVPDAWRALSPEGMKSLRAEVVREAIRAKTSPQSAWSRVEKSIEMDAALARYREAGVNATYHCCDATNIDALAAALNQIRNSDGTIYGVMHGAGLEFAGRMAKKDPGNVQRVIDIKHTATLALMKLTEQDRPKFFVGFGSTSGRFGGYLQADYSLANDLLCKIVNNYAERHPDCRAFSIHWTAWDDVGMGMRGEGKVILDNIGVARMSVAEGIEHLIDELQAQSHDSEILLCDHPHGIHSDQSILPDETQQQFYASRRELLQRAPIVEQVACGTAGQGAAWAAFDPTTDPFLLSHLDSGTPLFPAVMGIETCAEAAHIFSGGQTVVEVRDFKLVNGLRMTLPRRYRNVAHFTCAGSAMNFRFNGEYFDKDGRLSDPERQYQTCTLEVAGSLPQFTAPDFGPVPEQWTDMVYPQDWRTRVGNESGTVFYGPALRALKAVVYLPDHSAWGRIVVPPVEDLLGQRAGDGWQTHPAVLDAVLLGCDLFATQLHKSEQFPSSIEKLRFGRQPQTGETCLSRTWYRGRDERYFVFDFWLKGADGAVIYACEGCRFVDIHYSMSQTMKRT